MTHDEVKMICEARKLAQDNGMFVVEKGGRFLLYRKRPCRNIPLGSRADLAEFRRFVTRVARSDGPRTSPVAPQMQRKAH